MTRFLQGPSGINSFFDVSFTPEQWESLNNAAEWLDGDLGGVRGLIDHR